MREFTKFIHFIDGRRALYGLMTKEPEKMPARLMQSLPCDVVYERDARMIIEERRLPLVNSHCLYFALSELYRFGGSHYFPGILVTKDICRSAYWLLHAFTYNNRSAFLFLHSMVPECFIEDFDPFEMLSAIECVLTEIERLSSPSDNIKERRKNEAAIPFIVDWLIYSAINIDKDVAQIGMLLKAIDQEVEPYQVSSPKQN